MSRESRSILFPVSSKSRQILVHEMYGNRSNLKQSLARFLIPAHIEFKKSSTILIRQN